MQEAGNGHNTTLIGISMTMVSILVYIGYKKRWIR